jgi:hypothetical protein
VAELADAPDSKSVGRKALKVVFAHRAATLPSAMRLEHSSVIPLKRMPALARRRTFEHWLDGQRGLVRILARRILPIFAARRKMLTDRSKTPSQYRPIAFRCGCSCEGIRARKHLVDDDRQSPQVPPRIDFMARQLFRRHVAHCSDDLSRIRINSFLWTVRLKLREPEGTFRSIEAQGHPMVESQTEAR